MNFYTMKNGMRVNLEQIVYTTENIEEPLAILRYRSSNSGKGPGGLPADSCNPEYQQIAVCWRFPARGWVVNAW
jgi:hypothetical protein